MATASKANDLFGDCAKLKDLTGAGADVDGTFDAMAGLLSSFGRPATVQFRLQGDEPARVFVVTTTKTGATVSTTTVIKPSLEIVTRHATWRQIAKGGLSPLEAFATGRMRVLGSTALGVKLLDYLRGSGTRIDLC